MAFRELYGKSRFKKVDLLMSMPLVDCIPEFRTASSQISHFSLLTPNNQPAKVTIK